MENELKARITADISNFTAGMAKVESNLTRAEAIFAKSAKSVFQIENALTKLSKQYKEGSISEAQFAKQSEQLSKSLIAQRDNMAAASREVDRLQKILKSSPTPQAANAVEVLSNKTKDLASNTVNANAVAINFNRTIQSAPFGIISLTSNLRQLVATFTTLEKRAGGVGPAIKATFATLVTGPNIALLAVTAITTALSAFQMGLFKSKSEADELVDEIDRLREASDKYVKSLDAVSSASLKGTQNSVKEITELRNLYKATQDTTLGIEQRRKAAKELIETYPNAFKGITEETILNGKAEKSYINLTNAILARAKAIAAQDVIVENERKLLALQSEREKVNKEILANETQIDNFRSKTANTGVGQLQSVEQQLASSLEKTNEGPLLRRAELSKQINELTNDNLNLVQTVNSEQEKTGNILDKSTKQIKSQKEILSETVSKIFSESDFIKQGEMIGKAISDGIISKSDGDRIKSIIAASLANSGNQELQDALQKSFQQDLDSALSRLDKTEIKDIKIEVNLPVEEVADDVDEIIEELERLQAEVESLEKSFEGLIERESFGILRRSAGEFGLEIAKSFETGNAVLDSFVKNLFRAVPQIIAAYARLSAARAAQTNAQLIADGKEAAGGGVNLAVKAANALGPVGLAVLPVLIAGALSLIAGSFSKVKGGGSGGGTAQSFGNLPGREFGGPVSKGQAYIVGEKRPEIFVPSTSGIIIPQMPKSGGVSTGSGGTMKIEVEVKGRIDGESIRLSNKRAGTRVRNT
jgi:predicted  nucleic acid-binding Zn-ribbon protein